MTMDELIQRTKDALNTKIARRNMATIERNTLGEKHRLSEADTARGSRHTERGLVIPWRARWQRGRPHLRRERAPR